MGRRGLRFLCKVTPLFCNNKIKTEIFLMFCKILLELCLLMDGIHNFLLGEEKFTATPWRLFYGAGEKRIMRVGVNIFLVSWVCSCIMGVWVCSSSGGGFQISDFS